MTCLAHGYIPLSALNRRFREERHLPDLLSQGAAHWKENQRTELILKNEKLWGLAGAQRQPAQWHELCFFSRQPVTWEVWFFLFGTSFFMACWLSPMEKLPLHLRFPCFSGKCSVYKSPFKYRVCVWGGGCLDLMYLQAWS